MGNSLRVYPGPRVAGLGRAGRRLRRPLEDGAGRRQESQSRVGDQHLPPEEAQPPEHRPVSRSVHTGSLNLYHFFDCTSNSHLARENTQLSPSLTPTLGS